MSGARRLPRAAVLVTGSEILLGRTQDTNSGFLARRLDAHGVRLERVVCVDDRQDRLEAALRRLLDDGFDLVVTSGGLGPTHDDRTVAAVAAAAGRSLVVDDDALALVSARTAEAARSRGLDPAVFEAGNRKQATIPEGATVLPPVGTAPGLVLVTGDARVVVLPGPPSELRRMWEAVPAEPLVADLLGHPPLERRVLRIYGVPESQVADLFAELGGDEGGTETSICASRMEIEVVIRPGTAPAGSTDLIADGLCARLGAAVYAQDERPLEEHVVEGLRAGGSTFGTAESCTAGLVAARVANVPGSSDMLLGGIVAYANQLKQGLLDVSEATLRRHGAVSAETARAMADGARRALGVDVAVSVTGVAGPGGGTPEKPVGLVYLHASGPEGGRSLGRRFPGDRQQVREWSATAALHLVRLLIESGPDRP